MNRLLYIVPLIAALMGSAPAYAQAVEAVPLSAPTYTLGKETDPMAMDPGTVTPDEKVINRGEAVQAPPPPGVACRLRRQTVHKHPDSG